MDICSHVGFPVNDVNSLHRFCTDTLQPSYGSVGDILVDELSYGATKISNTQVDVEQVSVSIPLSKKDVTQMKNECLESHQSAIITKAHENDDDDVITSEVVTHDDNAQSASCYRSSAPSLPKRLKPVSAMKGGREKHGLSPSKQLTVKWAPDVYDPVPTSTLQMVISRPHKRGKKKSKNKQKNVRKSKSSGGS